MFILALDYDGTLFEGSIGQKGNPRMDVINKALEFRNNPLCEIVLWTCRDAGALQEAIDRCKEFGLTFDSVNSNSLTQVQFMRKMLQTCAVFSTRKIFADIYIDDRSPGSIEYFLNIDVEQTCKNFEKRT